LQDRRLMLQGNRPQIQRRHGHAKCSSDRHRK
jgi:hypothetical protein